MVSRETFGTALADLQLPPSVIDQLVRHWELVCEWNRRTNLTAIHTVEDAAWLHYRDSLEALSVLPDDGGSIVDIGSGGGFPGIPIAAAEPARSVTLVEPRRKRASFLEIATARMGLSNAHVLTTKVEDPPPDGFAAAVTRATFSNPSDLKRCLDWLQPGGTLIAFRSDPGELQPDTIHWYELKDERRCLLIWRQPSQSI